MANKIVLDKKGTKKISRYLIVIFIAYLSFVYSAPSYKGQVIDFETKQPLENVLVAVIYGKETFVFVDVVDSTVKTKTMKTDNNGEFCFPVYFNIKSPFSWRDKTRFFIYLPGYGELDKEYVEECFVSNCNTKEFSFRGSETKKVTIKTHLVELPPLSGFEEELKGKQVTFPIGVKY